jgi:para-aminobenzoate synthetase component 1
MEIINELEESERGVYCGSVFYQSVHGNFDSNILIRTIARDHDTLTCWAGGGIVADSKVEDEYQESLDKVAFLTGIVHADN